ncbi:MAG TPA: 2-iminoacetate synthase ThiH [Chitinophagales bacterium]|nr:2-iminoacetate synthase ThiH [Chitinophagales bacterium]
MFTGRFHEHDWNRVSEDIQRITPQQVRAALERAGRGTPEDFLALISPSAEPFLEEMAAKAFALTRKRFGNTVQMFIPMYLSNECQNICTYCGFRYDNELPRVKLTDEQILNEAEIIKGWGYDHVLLVTGEANKTVGVDYIARAVRLLKDHFSNISVEVQPLDQNDYETLIDAGVYAVLVYQETYHQANYKLYHPKGKKSNFTYRLETPDRLGRAGVHKIGLGVLLGLEDWRVDSFFTALHIDYLQKKYWKTKYSVSFPRLRPAVGMQDPNHPVSNKQLVQLICAYRLFNEDLELSISTREEAGFRDNLFRLGITSTSAGSKTSPGGYASSDALEQFEIDDTRSPAEVAAAIKMLGLEPVWKDWETVLN